MSTELQNTSTERAANEEVRTIQISLQAWKKAKIHAVQNDSTLKAVVEKSIDIFTGAAHVA